ncbi:stAR-related lipid transfer protein 9 isoform X2 [Engraulis encrasicolus]|uniref:stAR-related lipid transfer protein 9 isoform X2 n=1 Tax=Engraulis encrasicolus TaxID=184585 RepID=UPI002FD4818F
MANVKVAIRVRPLNSRESADGGRLAVQVEEKVVRVKNLKLEGRADSRECLMEFGFDYCYWSVDPEGPNYASQEEVFQDLGVSVLAGAWEGYNVCLFAYGQTGTGKTYTMIGTPDSMGLTPRICQGLFHSPEASPNGQTSSRVEVSFLEIYNERVRDLLRDGDQKKPAVLRVREHPETGPYVQGLSQHQVTDYKQTLDLLERGISNRITAATHVHDASSRSHAIFTIQYTQATLENNLPSEIVSKINLVDLAGSERADPQYCRDRITEGANINKSLVTLGIVISALAQNSQMFSSCPSINSVASEAEGSLLGGGGSSMSSSSGSGGGGGGGGRRHCFIPYRDSVLTWLLKDSLGGNSKTIMIATVSPSCSSYSETVSTLRYAAHARNIVNKPRVNEDANVRLIRELREEIDRLKTMLLGFEMQRNPSPSLSDERDGSLSDIVLQNELKVDQLTKDWSEGWSHKRELLEQYSVDINRDRAGFLVHSLVPHLIALDRDVLSTGVTFYHLREGLTRIGSQATDLEEPQIALPGSTSCEIENQGGVVTLRPTPEQVCTVNGREVAAPCRLAQGAVITLGQYKFRFNHPAEAALLRARRRTSSGSLDTSGPCCESSTPDADWRSVEGDGCSGDASPPPPSPPPPPPPWRRVEEQQRYVELLHEEIQVEQRRAEQDLKVEQAKVHQQQSEIQQWVLKQKQRLAAIEQKVTHELGVQTDLLTPPLMHSGSGEGGQEDCRPPSALGDCKRVVQEELLRHHALGRVENRVRRKRLHYQLQRIARKRHLLEAKQELQRLVNSVPPGQEGPSSLEMESSSRGRPVLLRRHSFSADLLSRLYPQHTPIFSQFLRRHRSSEFMSFGYGPRKYSSDDRLSDQPMRGRSQTLPSGYVRRSRSRARSSENLKSPLKDRNTTEASNGNSSGTKTGTTRRGSLPRSRSNSQSKDTTLDENSSKACKKHLPIISKGSQQKNSSKGSHGSNKGLEKIRKVFSHSVGTGIKTALAKVFRKPPLGLRAGRSAKSFKTSGKPSGKSGKGIEDCETTEKQGKAPLKATVSLDNLEHAVTASPEVDPIQRRWHSAEALSPRPKRSERGQQDLAQWIESLQEEEGNMSDCDSLFSTDSLSSAYAAALAEQLRQEEGDQEQSEPESVDSQMSEDSLVMAGSGKHATVRPAVKHMQAPNNLLLCSQIPQPYQEEKTTLDSHVPDKMEAVMEVLDEMPAEAYWSLGGTPKMKVRAGGMFKSNCDKPLCVDSDHEDNQAPSKMNEQPASPHLTTTSTPRSLSNCSVREPESLLALTDAWSSMDAADSPRMPRPTSGHKASHDRLNESERSLSLSFQDLSDHISGSDCHSSLSAESTDGENTTLQVEKCWESDKSSEEDPQSHFLRSSEVVLSSGNTLTLTNVEMLSETDGEQVNSQDVEESKQDRTQALVNKQLIDSHAADAHSSHVEIISSNKTKPSPVHVSNNNTHGSENMSATAQSQFLHLSPNSAIADVLDSNQLIPLGKTATDLIHTNRTDSPEVKESLDFKSSNIGCLTHGSEMSVNSDLLDAKHLVPQCQGANLHINPQGSDGKKLAQATENIKSHKTTESIQSDRMCSTEVKDSLNAKSSNINNLTPGSENMSEQSQFSDLSQMSVTADVLDSKHLVPQCQGANLHTNPQGSDGETLGHVAENITDEIATESIHTKKTYSTEVTDRLDFKSSDSSHLTHESEQSQFSDLILNSVTAGVLDSKQLVPQSQGENVLINHQGVGETCGHVGENIKSQKVTESNQTNWTYSTEIKDRLGFKSNISYLAPDSQSMSEQSQFPDLTQMSVNSHLLDAKHLVQQCQEADLHINPQGSDEKKFAQVAENVTSLKATESIQTNRTYSTEVKDSLNPKSSNINNLTPGSENMSKQSQFSQNLTPNAVTGDVLDSKQLVTQYCANLFVNPQDSDEGTHGLLAENIKDQKLTESSQTNRTYSPDVKDRLDVSSTNISNLTLHSRNSECSKTVIDSKSTLERKDDQFLLSSTPYLKSTVSAAAPVPAINSEYQVSNVSIPLLYPAVEENGCFEHLYGQGKYVNASSNLVEEIYQTIEPSKESEYSELEKASTNENDCGISADVNPVHHPCVATEHHSVCQSGQSTVVPQLTDRVTQISKQEPPVKQTKILPCQTELVPQCQDKTQQVYTPSGLAGTNDPNERVNTVSSHLLSKPGPDLTLTSTLKGKYEKCLENSSPYLSSTVSGIVPALEEKGLDVPKEAQISHGTKVDVIRSLERSVGENANNGIDHSVEGHCKIASADIPVYTKDLLPHRNTRQSKDVLDSLGYVSCYTTTEASHNQELESQSVMCRKSRKRNKDSQDALSSSLKFPKRSHSSPPKSICPTSHRTEKDNKDNYNNQLNESFTCKDEHLVTSMPCILSEEKCVSEQSVAEKNIENTVKITDPKLGRCGTKNADVISQKISEVVQKHLEMSIDKDELESLSFVVNSDAKISIQNEKAQRCSVSYPSPSQTVPLKSDENSPKKDTSSLSQQHDLRSSPIRKDQTGCRTTGVSESMDTKNPRSTAGHTNEESLNKGSSVLPQQDIPRELQMGSKSKREIIPGAFKEHGKGVQSDACVFSASEGGRALSTVGSMQHTESHNVDGMEKHKAFVMTGLLRGSESSVSHSVETAVRSLSTTCLKRQFAKDVMSASENDISNISVPVLFSGAGEKGRCELAYGQFPHLDESSIFVDEIHGARTVDLSKASEYSALKNTSTDEDGLSARTFVATEHHPVCQSGQGTLVSQLNDPTRSENCLQEPPVKQTKIFPSQAEFTLQCQDTQSRQSHNSSESTEHLDLNNSQNTFSSHMTMNIPQQRTVQTCSKVSVGNSLKSKEVVQARASIQQYPTDKIPSNDSSSMILNAEGKQLGQDCLQGTERGKYSATALSQRACHKPQYSNVAPQSFTDSEQKHFKHVAVDVPTASQTKTKPLSDTGPKYTNRIELEVPSHSKYVADGCDKMAKGKQQLPVPLPEQLIHLQEITSNMRVKSEVLIELSKPRTTNCQLSKSSEDTDSMDNSQMSEYSDSKGHAKTKDGKGSRVADSRKVKTKRFRRTQAMTVPSTSSESVLDTSSEENILVKIRQQRLSTRTKSEAQAYGRQQEPKHSRASPCEIHADSQNSKTPLSRSQITVEGKVKDQYVLQSPDPKSSCTPVLSPQSYVRPCVPMQKNEPTETPHVSGRPAKSNHVAALSENLCKATDSNHLKPISNVSKQKMETSMENTTLKQADSVLHFASVDINPFIHPWQDTESSKPTYKNQVFGSAAEIASKYPLLNCPDKQITRCSSMDNGLNVENSPFTSHLSTYANSKGLSSTLSSVEDFKERVGAKSHRMTCHHSSLDADGGNMTAVSCGSADSSASVDLGNSSGPVDEIMLVYPSQQDSHSHEHEGFSMCDHSTQTITPGGHLKRRRCHHRSNSQVDTSLKPKVPATWTSLQDMSAHLSQLIHNTSDLLGNIECMRSGATQRQEHTRMSRVSKRSVRQTNMKDGSTQTVLDVGIQTEAVERQVEDPSKAHTTTTPDLSPRAHEVNVIVKVIGPNSLSASEGDDITLSLFDTGKSRRLSDYIKSMPDLRENRCQSAVRSQSKVTPMKVPSLETVLPSDSHITPDLSPIFPKGLLFDKPSPSGSASSQVNRCFSDIDVPETQTQRRTTKPSSGKQVSFTDRASSPILTVEAGVAGRKDQHFKRSSTPRYDTAERHCHIESQSYTSKISYPRTEYSQATSIKCTPGELQTYELRKTFSSSDISIGTISTGHISDLSNSTSDVSHGFLVNSAQGKAHNVGNIHHRNATLKGNSQTPLQGNVCPLSVKWVPSPSHHNFSYQQPDLYKQQLRHQMELFSSFDEQPLLGHQYITKPHRNPEDQEAEFNQSFEVPGRHPTLEHQDDDLMSVAPSECNTDVLVSINPLKETHPPPNEQMVPEDLPLHNKFNNWSGLSQHGRSQVTRSTRDKSSSVQNILQSESLNSSFNTHSVVQKDGRMSEIERLRKEREKVMASVHLEMNPHQLTVEMAEAKLHYGQGETDALLKALKSPTEQSPPITKQCLYNRHRRSIEGLREEREARLQTCRRARSLSPSKHGSLVAHDLNSSPKANHTPSGRREHLQHLRQEVVDTSRVPEPQRRGRPCPSEIEILLRDYSRAREEARTEIARARDRLRERTEQEKRRLQQQTLSQVVRDDLRFRNRVSNSTLCTGSSLSLASSPTSGYNSSNPAIVRDMQVAGASESGSKVVARPPIAACHNMKLQRTWTSAQDIRLEQQQGSERDSAVPSASASASPSSPPSLRPRALSFGSPSSLATAYQDIASRALTHALAEVRLASAGQLSNLLAGKSAAGWRHQGTERGVQVFHKSAPRATVHGFLGAMELQRPLESLWGVVRDHSKAHLYNPSVSSSWTRALDDSTQLVYMLSNPSSFNLKQPRDFCCISVEAKQERRCVLVMQSVYEESLPRPSVDAVRAEVLPSAWILQPSRKHGQDCVTVIYMLQVDLGPPALPHRLLGAIARKQASVIAELDAFLSL